MISLDEYVNYSTDGVIIPSNRIAACHAAIQAWADQSFETLEEALGAFSHHFERTGTGGLQLEHINLETRSSAVESLYRFLAPFVPTGGRIYCSDDQDQHLCYVFERSRVYRVEGRVAYDGQRTEL